MIQDKATRRVYNWESQWASWNTESLKLPQVRALVHKALRRYRLAPIPVRTHGGTAMTFYAVEPSGHKYISFNKSHKNAAIALHEAAHHICDELHGPDIGEHSPQWLGIYLWLLAKEKVAPRVALEASAKAMGLTWSRRMAPLPVAA